MINNKYQKVLLTTPISSIKKYIEKQWFDYIDKLTYDFLDYYFVDNSPENNYYKQKYGKIYPDFKFIYHSNNKPLRFLMCECNQLSRDYFLKNDYEWYFSLEQDVFPPLNCIEHLLSYAMAYNLDIVGLPYLFGKEGSVLNFIIENNSGGIALGNKITPHASIFYIDGTLKKSYQTGIGCLLIHRTVIEKIPFRVEDRFEKNHADTFFHEDLRNNGIDVYIDTMYIAEHINSDWNKIKDKI